MDTFGECQVQQGAATTDTSTISRETRGATFKWQIEGPTLLGWYSSSAGADATHTLALIGRWDLPQIF